MEKLEKLYEGKAKILYRTQDENLLIQYFKDSVTAFNAKKKEDIFQKGLYNNLISIRLFELLEAEGIKTHLVRQLSPQEMLVKHLTIIPLEVVVRNVAAGSLAKRLGLEPGKQLPETIIEFYFKDDDLGDPLVNEYHISAFKMATSEELRVIKKICLHCNQVLSDFLASVGIKLVDFKLEFGKQGTDLLVADEISPDVCRLWDQETGNILDKDRFRQNLGGLAEAYQEVWQRMSKGGG